MRTHNLQYYGDFRNLILYFFKSKAAYIYYVFLSTKFITGFADRSAIRAIPFLVDISTYILVALAAYFSKGFIRMGSKNYFKAIKEGDEINTIQTK